MATTTLFHDLIDLPTWRPLAVSTGTTASGSCIAGDLRNSLDRHHEVFELINATTLNTYNVDNDGWSPQASPGLAGTFGSGVAMQFAPQRGPRGTVATGSTTTILNLTLSAGLLGGLAINQLAARGDGRAFKIRIIGNGTASSGKIEEHLITASTAAASAATAITVVLDSALSWTPVVGDNIEILSGRVYMLNAGTVAAGIWKYFDVLTGVMSGNLSTTNLPSSIATESNLIVMDETYVPSNMSPGQGYFGNITATGSSSTTITGTTAGADSALLANEFRNFQIRIVQDTTTPTSVGQRRKITSHTAGPSVVYTVPTWTVTPSTTAQFVIENSNEILMWTSGQTSTYTYCQDAIAGGQATDSWSTSTYAARGTTIAAGATAVMPFGIDSSALYGGSNDPQKNFRYSQILSFRGGNTTTLDVFDLAAATAGTWASAIVYGTGPTFNTGSCGVYDPCTFSGKNFYVNSNGTNTFFRINVFARNFTEWVQLRYTAGTAVTGHKLATTVYVDGTTKIGFLHFRRNSGVEFFQCLIQR